MDGCGKLNHCQHVLNFMHGIAKEYWNSICSFIIGYCSASIVCRSNLVSSGFDNDVIIRVEDGDFCVIGNSRENAAELCSRNGSGKIFIAHSDGCIGRYFNLFIGTGEGDLRPVLRIKIFARIGMVFFFSTAPLTAMIGLATSALKTLDNQSVRHF